MAVCVVPHELTAGEDPVDVHWSRLRLLEKRANRLLKFRILTESERAVARFRSHRPVPRQFLVRGIEAQFAVVGQRHALGQSLHRFAEVAMDRIADPLPRVGAEG